MPKAKSKPVNQPVAVKAYSFQEVLAEQHRKAQEEQDKFNAMTDSEKEDYIKQEESKQAEVESLLKELSKYSGFTQIRF